MLVYNYMLNIQQFGLHLMIDGYSAPAETLNDKNLLLSLLANIPKEMGMYTICEPVIAEVGSNNKKDPGGISGFVMIAESHISFHTFPNRGFVTIDVYTCQNDLDTDKFVSLCKEAFKFTDEDIYIQKRGLRYPSEDLIT